MRTHRSARRQERRKIRQACVIHRRRHCDDNDVRADKIEMFYLPRRAPELNPDEYLNNDIHSGVNAKKLPDNQGELRSNIQRFLHALAKLPEHIMHYFQNPHIDYAAGTV